MSYARRSSNGVPHAARRPQDARHGGPCATQNGRPAARVALRPATLALPLLGGGRRGRKARNPLILPAEKTPSPPLAPAVLVGQKQ